MEINTLGAVLKYYREKYEILKDDLCDGICTSAILSKIESGEKIIDSLDAECLLGRIGKTVLQFELLLNDKDYTLWRLREEIKEAEQIENYMQIELLLEDYREQMPSKPVHEQYYLYHCAKCRMSAGASKEEICQMMHEALLLTKPKADEISVPLYNPMEIELLLFLYQHHFLKWEKKDVEKALLKILMHVQNVYSGRVKQEMEVRILWRLIEYKEEIGDYACAIRYIDEMVQFLAEGRSLEGIGELHFLKGKLLEKQYNRSEDWETKKRICQRECLQAYYVFDIMEQKDKRKEVENYCEEKLG